MVPPQKQFDFLTVLVFSEQSYMPSLWNFNINYCRKENNFIIFSDSMSSPQAVKSFRLELDLVYQIIKEYSHLTESGKRIVICWIPSHVNVLVERITAIIFSHHLLS